MFTGKFVFICVALQMLIGIFVGYQMQKELQGPRHHLHHPDDADDALAVVVGFLWRYMLNSEWGIVNFLLSSVGIAKVDWLGQTNAALLWAAAAADTWMWNALHRAAGHRRVPCIPETIYEAARGRWRKPRLQVLPHHAAHVGARAVHRADPQAHRLVQAVTISSSRSPEAGRAPARRPSPSLSPRPPSAISTRARPRRSPSSCSSSSSACR